MREAVVAFLCATFVGCVSSPACERERVETPDALVLRVRSLAREERWWALYDLLSARAQGEVSRAAFVIGAGSQCLPPPHGYKVVDVLVKGTYEGSLPDPANPDRAIVWLSYSEPGKPHLFLSVLVVREDGEWKVDGPTD